MLDDKCFRTICPPNIIIIYVFIYVSLSVVYLSMYIFVFIYLSIYVSICLHQLYPHPYSFLLPYFPLPFCFAFIYFYLFSISSLYLCEQRDLFLSVQDHPSTVDILDIINVKSTNNSMTSYPFHILPLLIALVNSNFK